MATALTSELTRFTDKCNNVLAGGIVKTFEPNSLTPKTSYQDPECTIPNLPEVNLDETGRARIYIQGDYRVQVYSRDGVLIEDNLLVEQTLVQRDFVELSQSLQVEQQETLNQVQAQTSEALSDFVDNTNAAVNEIKRAAGNFSFTTMAAFNAAKATIPANSTVNIDEAGVSQGLNTWNGTTLTKSAYDPLTQAKTDATTKANAAEANAKNYADTSKLDLSKIEYKYINGNMVGSKTKTVSGKGLNSALAYVVGGGYDSKVLSVTSSDTIYLLNSNGVYTPSSGNGYAFFDKDPSIDATAIRILDSRLSATDATTSLTYSFVVVPVGANYLVINSKFTNPINWAIHKNLFNASYIAGTEILNRLNGAEIEKQITVSAARSITNGNTQVGDIYQLSGVLFNLYINTQNALAAGSAGNDWRTFRFSITPGNTYFLKIIGALTYPFKINYSSTLDTIGAGTNLGSVTLQPTALENIYKFTVSESSTALAVFMNIKVDSGIYSFNISSTLSIQEHYFSELRIGTNKIGISQIDNKSIVDGYARSLLATLSPSAQLKSRLSDSKVVALGDSITAGTQGGYIKYLEAAFDTVILNHGSSGARARRVFDIVTAGEGLEKRDSSTAGTVWPAINWTGTTCVTLMIGTNDSDGSSFGSITDLPATTFIDHPTLAEYAALFPNNYLSNIAFVIEYIRNKAPKAEIHIITPPYRFDAVNGTQRITKLIPALEAVSKFYGVHLIYGTYESGIGFKEMNGALNIYSYDDIHFNEVGNEVFGKFIAQKVLSFG